MSRAQITRIVPVSDQILLLVFKDTQTGEHNELIAPDSNPTPAET